MNRMNVMHPTVCLSALLFLLSSFSQGMEEISSHHGNLESVDVLKNGSLRVSGSYEAVDLHEAATQAMPDDKLKGLLNWAISEFVQAI